MELKANILEKVFEVDVSDFEKLVKKEYGHHYSWSADEEMGNDSYKMYKVNGRLDDGPEAIEEFKKEEDYYGLSQDLLDDLCKNGKIEKGNYLFEQSY